MSSETELSRRLSLLEYDVLDTPSEEGFDRLTRLAAELFDAPIALVSLIDSERQWFKSRHGLEVLETPREWAFCDHVVRQPPGSAMVVTDATQDARFVDNPLVTGDLNVRFYAGAALTNAEGHNLGTLCVLDSKARIAPTDKELSRLKVLAQIVVDELELRRAMRKLDEKRRLLELAEHMSGVGHWRVDAKTMTVEWSDEVYRIHGVDPASYSPNYDAAVRFFDPDDQAKVNAFVARALSTGEGYEFEMTLRRADGGRRDVIARASAQRDEAGKITGVVGVFQDITEHKRTVAAVRESQRQYKLLADHVGDVIARVRLDGAWVYVSPAINGLLGHGPEAMETGASVDHLVEADRPLLSAAYAEMSAGLDEKTLQYRMVHKAGHTIWVENSLRLVRDADGGPAELVAAIRDITERKRLEDDLRLAQAEAEAATRAKSDFLANMSHELRTPLTSILGFSDLAAAQPELTPQTQGFIGRVGDASRALLCTVNDILDFSKLEAGQVTIVTQPVSPAALCRSTLDLLTPQAAAKDIDLEFVCDAPADLCVAIDPDRMRQILLNMIGNAVKFTESGRVWVRLSYAESTAKMRIDVVDTGPGLSPEEQSRLFQRFSQIDGSLARKTGGTGLGLAICKGLVEAMGGALGVTSEVGRGSCFWFQIPARIADAKPTAAGIGEGPAHLMTPGVRVLAADDHHANRDLVRLILNGVGAEVTLAEDGRQAVELASMLPYDVILLDVRMPVLDGPGACAEIRAGDGPNAGAHILAFTADAVTGRLDLNPISGFDGVVFKPVDSTTLIAAIAEATDFTGQLQREAMRDAG